MSRKRSAVLLAVAVLAGCGGKEGTPPTPAPAAAASPTAQARAIPMAAPSSSVSLDPCRLLTGQEIAAALHTAVGDGVAQKRPQSASCRWAAASGLESATVSVTVYGDAKEARAAFDEAVEANGYRPLRGLGQGAYSSPMYDLTVLSGRYELAVDVNVMSEDQAPVARSLAQQAVPRLPR